MWNVADNKGLCQQAVLKGHAGAVTTADGLQLQTDSGQTEIIIVTSSVDFNVKIWKNKTTDCKGTTYILNIR